MKQSLPRQKKLVSISEAAKVLDISIDTVRRWDKAGIIHSERKNGKNRYFSLAELEKHKAVKPLSISEAAKLLNVSATTLRRLEKRGTIKTQRNSAGERTYDQLTVKKLLDNKYFLRKKTLKETRPSKADSKKPAGITSINPNLAKEVTETPEETRDGYFDSSVYKIFGFVGALVIFLLLTGIGLINVQVSAAQKAEESKVNSVSEVLNMPNKESLTKSLGIDLSLFVSPTPSPASVAQQPEAEPLTVKILGVSSQLDLGQKTATESSSAGSANDFEISSVDSKGYHIKLPDGSIGFIPLERIQKEATASE